MDPIIIVIVVLALASGYFLGALLGRTRASAAEARAERLPLLESRLHETEVQLSSVNAHVASLKTQLAQERSQNEEKLELLRSAREELTNQFRNLANDILEEKSQRFSEQNQQRLGQLLEPLKTRLREFQGKVEQVYVQEGKDRSALAEQVRQLMELNRTVSQEANNLTRALKGSNKTQGNWGELILERVLETAGLRKDEEFHVQQSHTTEDGHRLQPDVILHLPEDRHLIIDAKATLIAYEEYANSGDDKQRDVALKRHLEAVRSHIKGLSDKNYQALYGLKSLDFVLMFIPIEPAFMLAIKHDDELFMEAWHKNVLLVSPSTLLFVLRTVATLWRQEAQNRNAQDIAKRGAELYDKLANFVEDMESLGSRLSQAQKNYDDAISKLTTGRGNLIRQAEMLRDLGVKPNKSIPSRMLEQASNAAGTE